MNSYDVTIPGVGSFTVESKDELTDAQAYRFALDQAKAEAKSKSIPESVLAGLGAGFGRTVLGGQQLIGQGLEALGAEQVGKYLTEDAIKGRQKLLEELSPYAMKNPVSAGAGKMVGEIIPTLPVGGILAKGASAIPGSSAIAPLIDAIRTSGGAGGNLATRAAGGAITGATSAAMVDQDSAGLGGLLGAAIPVAGAVISKGTGLLSGKAQTPEMQQAIKTARESGYVIPPTQANPSLINRVLEGTSGKATAAQNASLRNQEVTNKLAARSLGLPDDTTLSAGLLAKIREDAGGAYEAVKSLPSKPSKSASSVMNIPAEAEINPKELVKQLKQARYDADAYYKSYNRTADPETLAKAKAFKDQAQKIESTIEEYAKSLGRTDLLPELKKARELIAKTYSVENALNLVTGNVSAKELSRQLEKGKPLSEGLKQAAEFSARFPKATQSVESMGSLPQISPLDLFASGGLTAATGDPRALATMAARPAARSLALSKVIQDRLIQKPKTQSELIELLKQLSPATAASIYSKE